MVQKRMEMFAGYPQKNFLSLEISTDVTGAAVGHLAALSAIVTALLSLPVPDLKGG